MPVIEIYSPIVLKNQREKLKLLAQKISNLLNIDNTHVWILIHKVDAQQSWVPHWNDAGSNSPIVKVRCKNTYTQEQTSAILNCIANDFSEQLNFNKSDIFILIDKVLPSQLYARNEIWGI